MVSHDVVLYGVVLYGVLLYTHTVVPVVVAASQPMPKEPEAREVSACVRYHGVTMVLQGYYKGVTRVLQ